MADLIKLCKTEEVAEGEMLQVSPQGLPSLAVYHTQGEFYVTDDMCTHGMAWMTDGYLEEYEAECPFHGGKFDVRTGAPTAFPCVVGVKSYAVTIEDGQVCIDPTPVER